MLDIVHDNWPHVISGYSAGKLKLAHIPTDNDVKLLRKAQINTLTQRPDGTVHVGPGGGVTTKGTSVQISLDMAKIKKLSRQLQNKVSESIKGAISSGAITAPVQFRLTENANGTFAEDATNNILIDLQGYLRVPPL